MCSKSDCKCDGGCQDDGRPVVMWEISVDLDPETREYLRCMGLKLIVEDDDALINYAANIALWEQMNNPKADEEDADMILRANKLLIDWKTRRIIFRDTPQKIPWDDSVAYMDDATVVVKGSVATITGTRQPANIPNQVIILSSFAIEASPHHVVFEH